MANSERGGSYDAGPSEVRVKANLGVSERSRGQSNSERRRVGGPRPRIEPLPAEAGSLLATCDIAIEKLEDVLLRLG